MSGPRVVLHVGMPRSTAILRPALARLQPQLRKHRVAYVGGAGHHRFADLDGWARTLAEQAEAELARTGRSDSVLVVSDDDLLGAGPLGLRDAQVFRPHAAAAIGRVLQAIGNAHVRIVLYTHRQDRLMELAYLQRLGTGRTEPLADIFPRRFEPVLDYRDLRDRLAKLPGVREVILRPVELADAGTHAFVEDFLALLGLGSVLDLDALRADIAPHPRTYTERGVALAVALTPLLDGAAETTLLGDFLTDRHSTGDAGVTDVLSLRDRQLILDAHGEANRALFAEHVPGVPADSYRSDIATFGLGNLLEQPLPRGLRPGPGPAAGPVSAHPHFASHRLTRAVRPLRRRAAGG